MVEDRCRGVERSRGERGTESVSPAATEPGEEGADESESADEMVVSSGEPTRGSSNQHEIGVSNTRTG